MKLGNRVKCSARYSVPMNLFIASVGPTGLSKTGHTTKLIDAPSAHIRLDAKKHHERQHVQVARKPKRMGTSFAPHR